jgi:hypothetical protein
MKDRFWDSIQGKMAADSSGLVTPVGSGTVFLDLFLWPSWVFFREYFLCGNIFKMGIGLSYSVHESVLVFGVNSRRYELLAGNKAEMKKIRSEF